MRAREARAHLLGPFGYTDFKKFVKQALPYEGKDDLETPQVPIPSDDTPMIAGPGPAHSAPSPHPEGPSPGPTKAGTPGPESPSLHVQGNLAANAQ